MTGPDRRRVGACHLCRFETTGSRRTKGVTSMAIQDTFNGAKNAFAFYGAYLNTVAQELGMERALALHTRMLEGMGPTQGKAIREQAGDGEIDAKAAYSLAKAVPESLGLVFEVQEESPSRVRWRWRDCSAPDAG